MLAFNDQFSRWVTQFPWWLIFASLAVFVFSAYGLQFLTFNNDLRVFFSEENPQLQALEALENTYTKTDSVIFVIAPKDGNVFTAPKLDIVEKLTLAGWQTPYANRVDSLSNFQYTYAQNDDIVVKDLVENAQAMSDADTHEIKTIALAEPLLVNRLLSANGAVTGVFINIIKPGNSAQEVTEVANYAFTLRDQFRRDFPDVDFHITGSVMFDHAYAVVGQEDATTLIPIMFLLLILVIGLAIRSIMTMIATLLISLLSMITGMGLAGWLGIELTTASINAPVIILTLAIADSVHILITMYHGCEEGKTKREAIESALSINLRPVFLTSATTIIGFLSMNFSDAPPFRDLGNVVAIGVAMAFLYSVFLLPALAIIMPVKTIPKTKTEKRLFDALATIIIERKTAIFSVTTILVISTTIGIFKLELNDNWVKYFDERYDIRTGSDFFEDNLTGIDIIEYSLPAEEPGGISDPAYLEKVDEFANWFKQQNKVVHVNSVTEIFKRLNKNMHGDDEQWYRLPDNRELAAQYLLLYEMSLPFGLDLNNQINIDKSSSKFTVTLRGTNTAEQRQIDNDAKIWLQQNTPQYMQTDGTGLTIIWAYLSERNIRNMLVASFAALILISALLILALRSIKLGLISLVPNLAPAVMAFGMWGLFVNQLGLGLSVVVSMTLGIVVDDTVHFINKYVHARRQQNLSANDAVHYSFATVGSAMWVTTAALVCGFFVLFFSGFKMSADMGLMSALTILLALIIDFLLLPVLLIKSKF